MTHLRFAKVTDRSDEEMEIPPAWTAAFHPWTFVITLKPNGTYSASARNANTNTTYEKLGTDYLTLDGAEEACRRFLVRQQQ